MDTTEDMVTEVAGQLSGGAGLGAPAFWSGKQGAADDGSRLIGVDREWATPLGHLL